MREQDHYATLGVDADADADEIRQAYLRAARRHHPDRNPGDLSAADRFKRVREAYEVLGDPARRAAYRRPAPPPPRGWAEAYAASRGRDLVYVTAAARPWWERLVEGVVGSASAEPAYVVARRPASSNRPFAP